MMVATEKRTHKQEQAYRDVLCFIGRFTTNRSGMKKRKQVIEAFRFGCCYWFAFILAERFKDEYDVALLVDFDATHFATEIEGMVFDIGGDITDIDQFHWTRWDDVPDDDPRKKHALMYGVNF